MLTIIYYSELLIDTKGQWFIVSLICDLFDSTDVCKSMAITLWYGFHFTEYFGAEVVEQVNSFDSVFNIFYVYKSHRWCCLMQQIQAYVLHNAWR